MKKIFENLDKTKNFNSLKFSICLNQREIIYSMDQQNFDFPVWCQIPLSAFCVFLPICHMRIIFYIYVNLANQKAGDRVR